jgi:secreted PhoX family phosphatase
MDRKVNTQEGGIEEAIKGLQVSRRWLLRNTANAAAGMIAASAIGAAKVESQSAVQSKPDASATITADDHLDKPAGYIHSLHGWDTI